MTDISEQEKVNTFTKEYNELCLKHGFQIISQPVFVPTNHGSFELIVKLGVEKLNIEQKI